MYLNRDDLHIETSETGARINTLQLGEKHFIYPQQFVKKNGETILRGGMHVCSPVFGPSEDKGIFYQAPQHGELRNFLWTGNATGGENPNSVCYLRRYNEWGADILYSVHYSITHGNQLVVDVDTKIILLTLSSDGIHISMLRTEEKLLSENIPFQFPEFMAQILFRFLVAL